MSVLVALQQRLESMDQPKRDTTFTPMTAEERKASEDKRLHHGRVMKDRDELAMRQVLEHTRLKDVTFWKITDLYKDHYYFAYVVDEFVREAQRCGCSWVAAPAPRSLPILGAVSIKGGFPACYIHKKGELPGETRSVSQGPYRLELPSSLSLKGHKIALIDDGVSSGGSMLACAELLEAAGGEVVTFMAPVMYQYPAAIAARQAVLSHTDRAKIFTLFDLYDKPPVPIGSVV
jgi:adenine/guanine phosphoribosyltransferase-like PRPP-binding protein